MTSFLSAAGEIIQLIAAMGGCLCSKQVVTIDGANYRVKERIAEG
jgi:hypothetical protein